MLSPFTDHLVLLDDEGVSWTTGKHLQHPQTSWHRYQAGAPLAACVTLLDQVPRAAVRYLDRVTLVLGFPYVHYLILPWQEDLYSPADWQGFAQALFSQQSSIDPEQWQLGIAHAPFGAQRLAVAVSKNLLQDVRALFKAKHFVLQSCHPSLTFALQRYWQDLPGDYVFAVPQTNALSCLFVHQGMPTHVCALHVRADALLRDSLIAVDILSGDHAQETLVVATSNEFLQQPSTQPWRWLGPLHPWLVERS